MHRILRGLLLIACAGALQAQAQPSQPQPAGLEADWDIAPVLGEIGAHAGRLLPALDRIDVKAWVERGASETYLQQWQSSKDQARALADGAKALARNPEQLSAGLQLFFRIQGLESMLASLEEGARKYQSPADAQALASLEAENGANRNRFQQYLVSLAAEQEQQLKVMDEEAQRCRGLMTPPASKAGKKR